MDGQHLRHVFDFSDCHGLLREEDPQVCQAETNGVGAVTRVQRERNQTEESKIRIESTE